MKSVRYNAEWIFMQSASLHHTGNLFEMCQAFFLLLYNGF